MSRHNVVLGYLPHGSQGIGDAARVATDMRSSFPSVELHLLLGIGGGVLSQRNRIRLGDVVVAMPEGTIGGRYGMILGRPQPQGLCEKDIWRLHLTAGEMKLWKCNWIIEQRTTEYPTSHLRC